VTTFTDLGVSDAIADVLHREGFDAPFAIQTTAVPDALDGRDVSGCAPTGSGKTLAFSIPVASLVGEARPHRPRALLLTPTRELAGQIKEALIPLAKVRNRSVATFYGGTNVNTDIKRLRRGVDIAVCTPGRLADLVQQGECDLSDVDIVVLDEADRMADMGFLPEVKRLLDRTSANRQTLLFSATLDGDVDVLVQRYQTDPVRHEIEAEQADLGDVRHLFWSVTRQGRRPLATDTLKAHRGSAIVFCRTKRGADRLAKQLKKDGINTAAIHGDRSQNQRERALAQFSNGSVTTLVATDVAARGIHVDDVAMVLHYDLPGSDKDYVHRSGRTGRAGADGVVLSLVLDDQHDDVHAIQRALDLPKGLDRGDVRDLDRGGALVGAGATTNGGTGGRSSGSSGSSNGSSSRSSNGSGGAKRSSGSKSSGNRNGSNRGSNGSSNGGGSKGETPSGGARSRARRRSRR